MIELKGISKTYKSKKGIITEALKDINIEFENKGLVFIVGKSGSGKSTLYFSNSIYIMDIWYDNVAYWM